MSEQSDIVVSVDADASQALEQMVRASEAAHQLSVCRWDTDEQPHDLQKALDLRVAYALEHGSPGGPRIGHQADGVAELEKPYLRRRSAQRAEAPKTTRRRRASKKTASKKATAKKTAAPATTKKES